MATPYSEHQHPSDAPGSETVRKLIEQAIEVLSSMDGALLLDPMGRVVVALGSAAANEFKVLSLASALVQLARRTTSGPGRGEVQHIALRGDLGYFVAKVLATEHVLIALGRYETRLGLLMYDTEVLAQRISMTLSLAE